MRVLLVNPPKQNFYRQLGSGLPPLGIAYLGAVLRSAGMIVKLLDLDHDQSASRTLDFNRHDMVGISADTIGYPAALQVAAMAKRAGARVVMGGYHVTFQDVEALQTGAVDYVIRGEGEYPLLSLTKSIGEDLPLEDVPNLSFLKDGRLIRTHSTGPISELDTLPFPARDLLPIRKYRVFYWGTG